MRESSLSWDGSVFVFVCRRGLQISRKRIKVLQEKQIQGFVSQNMNDGAKKNELDTSTSFVFHLPPLCSLLVTRTKDLVVHFFAPDFLASDLFQTD